jgi:hypothetical protein
MVLRKWMVLWAIVLVASAAVAAAAPPETVAKTTLADESPDTGDEATLRRILAGLAAFCKLNPPPGRAIFVDADFAFGGKSGEPALTKGRLRLVRGSGDRFRFVFEPISPVRGVGRIEAGCGDFPWAVSAAGTVYRGTLDPDGSSPARYLDARLALYRTMIAGTLELAAGGMPDLLSEWGRVGLQRDESGVRCVATDAGGRTRIEWLVGPDGASPAKVAVQSGKTAGEVVFRQWELDAPVDPAIFEPPADKRTVEVRREDISRMMAAAVNFTVEGALRR